MGLLSLQWIGKGQVFNSGVRGELYQGMMRNLINTYWREFGLLIAIIQIILFLILLCSIV